MRSYVDSGKSWSLYLLLEVGGDEVGEERASGEEDDALNPHGDVEGDEEGREHEERVDRAAGAVVGGVVPGMER